MVARRRLLVPPKAGRQHVAAATDTSRAASGPSTPHCSPPGYTMVPAEWNSGSVPITEASTSPEVDLEMPCTAHAAAPSHMGQQGGVWNGVRGASM